MKNHHARKTVTIIGSGFSGTLTAIRLLQFANIPLNIRILEREEGHRYGGLAFGTSSTIWDHKLNLQAGRITLFREHAEDFLEWLNGEADRTEWPPNWKYHEFGLSCPVPRRIYGQYLKERLEATAKSAFPGVSLTEHAGEAIDIVRVGDKYEVRYISGDGDCLVESISSDYVILATGHQKPINKHFYDRIMGSDRFLPDPYAATAQAAFRAMDPSDAVLVVGTALAGFDAVLSLLNSGHTGRIVLTSRAGNLHPSYSPDHQHDIWQVRRPPFLDADVLTADQVVKGVREEFEYLRETLLPKASVSAGLFSERIAKAWEPYIPELVARLDAKDVRELFDRYQSLINTKRIGTVSDIGSAVRSRMKSFNGAPSMIMTVPGRILDLVPVGDGTKIKVIFGDGSELVVDRVVNCLGNEIDYSRPNHPLWQSVVQDRGFAQPHVKTGRGLEVTEHGQLVARDGSLTERLFCVGPMRLGDETARRGRLGSFVFSIGTIRNESFETAMEVLRQARYGADTAIPQMPDTVHYTLHDGIKWLVENLLEGISPVESDKLNSLVLTHVQQSTEPNFEATFRALGGMDRRDAWDIMAEDLAKLRADILKERDISSDNADRLISALSILVERHAVHAMCDLSKLSTWRAEKYTVLVQKDAPRSA